MKTNRCRGHEGFTVIECLVAMSIGVIILSSGFRLLTDDSRTYQSQIQTSEMRQNARSVMEMMSRDLLSAGYGMTDVAGYVPIIICNEPTVTDTFSSTAVTLRVNNKEISTGLSDTMPQTSAELKVTSIVGFVEGMRVLIADNTGAYQWMIITQVQNSNHLQHNTTDLDNWYKPENGTIITSMDEISYRYNATTLTVERMVNAGPWIAVAENVTSLNLRYFKGDLTEMTPDNDGDRSAIRKIRIELKARTAEKDRRTNRYNKYLINTEVAPRNLPYLAG